MRYWAEEDTKGISRYALRGGSGAEPLREALVVSKPMPGEKVGLFGRHSGEHAAVRYCTSLPGPRPRHLSIVYSSIVSVHRLSGNRYGMWVEKKSGKMWLWDSMCHWLGGIGV